MAGRCVARGGALLEGSEEDLEQRLERLRLRAPRLRCVRGRLRLPEGRGDLVLAFSESLLLLARLPAPVLPLDCKPT